MAVDEALREVQTEGETTLDRPSNEDARAQAVEERKALRTLLSPVNGQLQAANVLMAVSAVAAVAPYLGIALLGGALLADPIDSSGVWLATWVIIVGLFIRVVTRLASYALSHRADHTLFGLLRQQMADTIAQVPLSWFSKKSSGTIRKTLDADLKDMHFLVAHAQVDTIAGIVAPLSGFALALAIDWRLGLLTVSSLPFIAIIYSVMLRGQQAGMQTMNVGLARISETLTELVDGIAVIKTFGKTGQAHQRYHDATLNFRTFFVQWVGKFLRASSLGNVFLTAPLVLLFNLGGGYLMLRQGWVTPLDVVITTLIALGLPQTINMLSQTGYARSQAAQAAKRVLDLLNTPKLPDPEQAQVPTRYDVAFDDVTFGCTAAEPVLHNISLQLQANTITALVGRSGSGKSTLATLVPRFNDPTTGTVSIGGVDVKDIPPQELYQTVGFVLQDSHLLALSVVDNIRLAKPDASMDDVIAVAQAARIHDTITALPQGYDTIIGEDTGLSGGQQQRLAIARVMLADPPVLVFDEATAFADPESEAHVQQAINALLPGRTVLVIAHRLETIEHVNNIVVLDTGHIVESGTHQQLIQRQGTYHSLYQAMTTPAGTPPTTHQA